MGNPFTSASGSNQAAGGSYTIARPKMDGGGEDRPKFPAMVDMFGCLLVIKPTDFTKDAPAFEEGGKLRERFTVDLAILDGTPADADDNAHVVGAWYEGMYLSQGSIIGMLKKPYKNGELVLGRLIRVPRKNEREKYPNGAADIEKALKKAAARGDKVNFSWWLEDFTAEDEKLAMKFLANQKSVGDTGDED